MVGPFAVRCWLDRMTQSMASAITRAASKQTWYTIRFVVDRARVEDAYRAYAYFRWVDDIIDAETSPSPGPAEAQAAQRRRFLDRQQSLLDSCLHGEFPQSASRHERMLIDLVRHADPLDAGLHAYMRNMMSVMAFDCRRRGSVVSEAELSEYTSWLAIAVTEAMHHFIGHGAAAPQDETRYMAASGAHILHMLRDTYPDMRAGYFNVPRELLNAHSIGPAAVDSLAYRTWVESRVHLARRRLDGGKVYFGRVESVRHRLAGLAYVARFEWLIETLEHDGFRVRAEYPERARVATAMRMSGLTVARLVTVRGMAKRAAGVPVATRVRS